MTLFADSATNIICGTALTPGPPNRASILAALRAALLQQEPYGPMGGIPKLVRVDRSKDFLSQTVASALGALGVHVESPTPCGPPLTGTIETINGAMEKLLLSSMPRYNCAQKLIDNPVDSDQPALSFDSFVREVLAWVRWWNTTHRHLALDEGTPLQAWQQDPTPIDSVAAHTIAVFALEGNGKDRTIGERGISWRGRRYTSQWMQSRRGTKVRLRFMPNHDHEIEVFHAGTGTYLGQAVLDAYAANYGANES
jgi:putative transposase